jgi:hypothetical protein
MTERELTLAAVDAHGVLEAHAAEVLPAPTRRQFLGRSLAGVVALATGLGAAPTAGATSAANDVAILRFDLVLEYLQAALYTEAERLGRLSPKTLAWARVVGAHERAHALAIRTLLGRNSVPSPDFDFRGVTTEERAFIRTAVAFEELTAALLKWQAPRLDSRDLVAAVATLHSVETRHAAWIRHLIGIRPAVAAFDKPAAQSRMTRLIAATHFISRTHPKTSGGSAPRFTG